MKYNKESTILFDWKEAIEEKKVEWRPKYSPMPPHSEVVMDDKTTS